MYELRLRKEGRAWKVAGETVMAWLTAEDGNDFLPRAVTGTDPSTLRRAAPASELANFHPRMSHRPVLPRQTME